MFFFGTLSIFTDSEATQSSVISNYSQTGHRRLRPRDQNGCKELYIGSMRSKI